MNSAAVRFASGKPYCKECISRQFKPLFQGVEEQNWNLKTEMQHQEEIIHTFFLSCKMSRVESTFTLEAKLQ